MKKLRFILLLLSICTFETAILRAQKGRQAEVKRIDAYCTKLDSLSKKHKNADLVFADTADPEGEGKAMWRKFASEKALEKFREENSETYTTALNWTRNGKIVVSNFMLFSPSGDWARYAYQYFRGDGSLTRSKTELRTFYGGYIIYRYHYFDKRGKLIRKSVRYLDLRSKRPKKPTAEFADENSSWYEGAYFKKTSKLPFAHLLRRQKK